MEQGRERGGIIRSSASRVGIEARSRGGLVGDVAAVTAGVVLVVAAAVVGRMLLADGVNLLLPVPPLLAQWLPHVGPVGFQKSARACDLQRSTSHAPGMIPGRDATPALPDLESAPRRADTAYPRPVVEGH